MSEHKDIKQAQKDKVIQDEKKKPAVPVTTKAKAINGLNWAEEKKIVIPDQKDYQTWACNVALEPILDATRRFRLQPAHFPGILALYHKQQSLRWVTSEVTCNLAKDVEDFKTFTVEEQKYIKNMLSFFAFADGLVSENLVQRFTSDIGIQEAKCFFAEQNSMECVHAETYQALLETLVGSEKERDELHRGFETIPSLKAKMKWIECWMNPKINFVFRLLAFSVLEGISFSGAFCSIYWIKHIKPGMMPGLIQSNNFIARDEALHTEHAIALFKLWKQKPPQEMVQGIIHSAILVEDQFIDESLPLAFIGMNGEDMKLYLRFVADRHLFELGYKPLYGVKENPFSWMVNLNIEERNQFFESHPSYEQHKHTLVAAVSSATASTTNSNAAVSSASSSWDPSQFNLDSL